MIVDTGPLVAALNRHEASHDLAVSVLQEAGSLARIPVPVLVEVDHLTLPYRPHDPPVLRLLDAIMAGEHTLEPVGLDVLEAAVALDRRYNNLQAGLTECVVMALSARTREPVSTFDFRDFGAFTVGGRPLELVVAEGDVSN